MSRAVFAIAIAIAAAAISADARAQAADPHAGHHMPAPADPPAAADPHAGHDMPGPAAHETPAAADPHAGHATPAPSADPHAAHQAPAPASPHAGHDMSGMDAHAGHGAPADPHAGHAMPTADTHAGHAATGESLPVGDAPAPPTPTDHLADAVFGAGPMEAARAVLRAEHGGGRVSRVMLETLEISPKSGPDLYGWKGEILHGGDINRLVVKTEGEGRGGHLESAEVQALYSRAVSPYFDLQAGVRQDLGEGARRTYLTAGFEGMAPYWFEVEGAAFLSDRGDLTARLEGSYDLRLTQRLILEPRAELELAAQDIPEAGIGAGLSSLEAGLRLRYEVRREFAPYVGVAFDRKFGETADFARAAGESRADTRFVLGLRAWF